MECVTSVFSSSIPSSHQDWGMCAHGPGMFFISPRPGVELQLPCGIWLLMHCAYPLCRGAGRIHSFFKQITVLCKLVLCLVWFGNVLFLLSRSFAHSRFIADVYPVGLVGRKATDLLENFSFFLLSLQIAVQSQWCRGITQCSPWQSHMEGSWFKSGNIPEYTGNTLACHLGLAEAESGSC